MSRGRLAARVLLLGAGEGEAGAGTREGRGAAESESGMISRGEESGNELRGDSIGDRVAAILFCTLAARSREERREKTE